MRSANPGSTFERLTQKEMFCWVKFFFVSDDFSFSRFPLFPKLNENGHPWKSLAPNSELWKIDIFKKIAYIANSLFRTLISARFSFVSLLQKILYTQKFRVFKRAKNTPLKASFNFKFEASTRKHVQTVVCSNCQWFVLKKFQLWSKKSKTHLWVVYRRF